MGHQFPEPMQRETTQDSISFLLWLFGNSFYIKTVNVSPQTPKDINITSLRHSLSRGIGFSLPTCLSYLRKKHVGALKHGQQRNQTWVIFLCVLPLFNSKCLLALVVLFSTTYRDLSSYITIWFLNLAQYFIGK